MDGRPSRLLVAALVVAAALGAALAGVLVARDDGAARLAAESAPAAVTVTVATTAAAPTTAAATAEAATTAEPPPPTTTEEATTVESIAEPAPGARVPPLRGVRLPAARETLDAAGLGVRVDGGGLFGVVDESNWVVCDSEPAAGEPVDVLSEVVVHVERAC